MKSTPSTVDRAPLTRITINSNNSELKKYEEYENWDPVEIENRLKEILQIDKECFIGVDSEINEWEIYGAFGNKDGFCFIGDNDREQGEKPVEEHYENENGSINSEELKEEMEEYYKRLEEELESLIESAKETLYECIEDPEQFPNSENYIKVYKKGI